MTSNESSGPIARECDVVVVGAGFSGLYMLHRLRQLGFSVLVVDAAHDVGGTWYWNRYPGARCDVPTTDYTFSFDPELETAWTWSEKYATQPEIFAYAQFIAERYDLRRDIQFGTSVRTGHWDEQRQRWIVRTDHGDELVCTYYVMATGCLSLPKAPDINGTDLFAGATYYTSRWPHEGVDFSGQRVGVIGTGSSGIQSIPLIAAQAAHVTVFQRTANFSIPARNGTPSSLTRERLAHDRDAYREAARRSRGGVPLAMTDVSGVTASDDVRRARFEAAYAAGELFEILGVFNDQSINEESNEIVADMLREKIRGIVTDPATAETLSPRGYPFGTKRPCLDSGYYETFNQPHVQLVDLRAHPIRTITATGVETTDASYEFDALVFATGFDAMTGPLVAVDVVGRDGVTLRTKWADGPSTYLGLMTEGFPNFFTVTGPGSPSVLSNMMVSIEQHVDFIADTLADMRTRGFSTIEPTALAEQGWSQHVADFAAISLLPKTDSWYMGANVPGKPRVCLPYIGGVDKYRSICERVVDQGYLGFQLEGGSTRVCHDGVIEQIQPDVGIMLETMGLMGLPGLETLTVGDARGLMQAMSAASPLGPQVAHVDDGELPGAAGPVAYRLWRPEGVGPHPLIAYFHGGGWVLGSATSDESFCRDLCARTHSIVVSVDYRHAPESRFPAAADDALHAVGWLSEHAVELGAIPGHLAVAGWSAGANLAAVVCQRARDNGGPHITGQLLVCPVTDFDMSRRSYQENGEGFVLTRAVMSWFWDHYADVHERHDPRCAPLRGDLTNLPPAIVVTAQFDPLRDEGDAYAAALEAAGNAVTHIRARGHIHTSLTMVGVILSGADVRGDIASAMNAILHVPAESTAAH